MTAELRQLRSQIVDVAQTGNFARVEELLGEYRRAFDCCWHESSGDPARIEKLRDSTETLLTWLRAMALTARAVAAQNLANLPASLPYTAQETAPNWHVRL
jgi:hypothetical protein